jgi:formylglycine-generating enzyme required for sulfatase activity
VSDALRGGSSTIFWWGNEVRQGAASCDGCGSSYDKHQTAPAGSFKPNAFGVYDTMSNVTQWIADGSARTTGDPRRVVMRSGSWYNAPKYSHSAYRNGDAPTVRSPKIGFRAGLSP